MQDAVASREFADYQRETVRKLLERQSGVFALVLSCALALDAYRLHPSAEFARILTRLPVQIAVCVAVYFVLRSTRLGARFPTVVGAVAYATLASFGGLLLGDLGGLDGPFFYSAYVMPTFVMILPVTVLDRFVLTTSTVLAFVLAFFLPHPEHLTYRFAHIAFAYLLVITVVNIHFGHRTMLLLRERFFMERALERHGTALAEDNKRLEENVRKQTGSVRALLDRVESSRQEARTELARDLHDEMGQLVVGTRLELKHIERTLDAGGGLSTENLGYLHGLVDRLDKQVREKVRALRDEGSVAQLDEAFAELVATYGQMSETRIAVSMELVTEPSEKLREAMVAVTREALTNALKHASAKAVSIRLSEDEDGFLLEVEDDGVGPANREHAGFGVVGMRERAEALGGALGLERVEGAGTRLWATFHRAEAAS